MIKNSVSTFALLGLNLFVFVWLAIQQQSLMMKSGLDVLAILHAGANLNPFTLGGEPWRIITSMFLHFGIVHLLINMYALYSLGKVLEPASGTARFLMVYFFCGIAAGLSSLIFNLFTISAGASGALFGLYGYRLGAELIGSFQDREKLSSVVINFIIFVVVSAFISAQVNVDLSGHIGGCVAGLVLSVFHYKFRLLIENRNLAIALILLSLSMFALPRDQLHYYRIFQRVIKAEKHTNQLYNNNLDDTQLKDSLASILIEWDSIRTSIHKLQRVPSQLVADTASLIKYVELHKQETSYRISLIERESYVYLDSLEIVRLKFDSLPPFEHTLNFNVPEEAVEENEADTTDHTLPVAV